VNNILNFFAAHSDWLVPFLPLISIVVWFAIESRWDAYVRKQNYRELTILNELREKSIITQEEFDEKKEQLLSV
jgi:hypothetical protein